MSNDDTLVVRNLQVAFDAGGRRLPAVRDVSFDLAPGQSMAVVGESGSGKSAMARAVLGLTGLEGGEASGEIHYRGQDLLSLSASQLRAVRGAELSMVFQDSSDSLDPVFTVGSQLVELLRTRGGLDRRSAWAKAAELLGQVGIASPAERVRQYPHQFSGGMRQRVNIAMAIALDPRVLIADEPTTALDVTIQAEILRVIRRLVRELDMSLIFITHDLVVAQQIADHVAVMYAGQIVESGRIAEIFDNPSHPYTVGLLKSHPASRRKGQRLEPIPGRPASASQAGTGCAFAPRCAWAQPQCREDEPALRPALSGRMSRCHFAEAVVDRIQADGKAVVGGDGAHDG